MLNNTGEERESNLIFSKRTQVASIIFIVFSGVMIYIVGPYIEEKKSEQSLNQENTEIEKSIVIKNDSLNKETRDTINAN
jgi:membrane protein implicated in regulation of membrane protease activity